MKKFVINIKRRPDRLKQFQERCVYRDIEIVYGFDGKNSKNENKKENKIFESLPKRLQPGARGVWISHLRIWKKIVDQGLPHAMIFEDDAIFNEDFSEKMENVLNCLPSDGIVYFGGRFTKNFTIPEPFVVDLNNFIITLIFKIFLNFLNYRTCPICVLT